VVRSGNPIVDRYLLDGYDQVVGMSSRFAAAIAARMLAIQTAHGVGGHVAEIGTFQGRFFIALALALGEGEVALGMDLFEWPNDQVQSKFEANCTRYGVPPERRVTWKVDSNATTPEALREKIGGGLVRFFHVDGDHSRAALTRDLELATAVLAPGGVIVLDDMLHPSYPLLIEAVMRYLDRHPEMCVLAVIDRETIVAATKFILCQRDWFKRYEADLMAAFQNNVFPMGADFEPHWCLVLALDTKMAAID
jgi:predicted O-methyltransferase YrrM